MIAIAGGEDVAGPPGLKSPEVQLGRAGGPRARRRRRDALRLGGRASRAQALEHWDGSPSLGAEPGLRGRRRRRPSRARARASSTESSCSPTCSTPTSSTRPAASSSPRSGRPSGVRRRCSAEDEHRNDQGRWRRVSAAEERAEERRWRPSSCRSGRRAPSRRRSSGWARRSGSGCCRRAAACRPSASWPSELRISRSTLRQALTTLVQSGHLVSLRGRERRAPSSPSEPPLAERPASRSTRAPGRCSTTGSRSRPARCCSPPSGRDAEQLDRLEELVGEDGRRADDFEEYRRTDIRFHIGLAEAAGSPRLVERDDRRAGPDERPDRADRPPAGGADPLQRPAPAAGQGAAPRRRRRAPCG